MCRRAAWLFPSQARTPAAARQAVRDELADMVIAGPNGDALIEDTTLIVSELVTNAIVAGCHSIDLQLTVHHNHLVVAVWDDAPGRPRPAIRKPFRLRGRGLRLIDKLARAWTVQNKPVGKTIRVEVAAHPGAIGPLRCDLSIR